MAPRVKAGSPRSITRADVARLSGVSTAVVSYVLNNGPKPVAPQTRDRVLEAVRALNYRPNAAARALSKGSADSIGMLVAGRRNPYFAQLIDAIDRRARVLGHTLLVVSTENSEHTTLQHMNDLAAQRVRGVISFHGVSESERGPIDALGLPTVLINQIEQQAGFKSVRADYRGGTRRAVQHLIEHGHRRIGFVGADEGARSREQGWLDALAGADLDAPRPYMTEFSLRGGYRAGARIAAETRRPQALFLASDQMAMGLLAAFYDEGIRVPEDVAIVGFDDTVESLYLCPALTTVSQPMDAIAAAALSALLDETSDPDQAIETDLVIRQSCGCGGSRAA